MRAYTRFHGNICAFNSSGYKSNAASDVLLKCHSGVPRPDPQSTDTYAAAQESPTMHDNGAGAKGAHAVLPPHRSFCASGQVPTAGSACARPVLSSLDLSSTCSISLRTIMPSSIPFSAATPPLVICACGTDRWLVCDTFAKPFPPA